MQQPEPEDTANGPSKGDEQIEGVGLSDHPELADPAIVVAKKTKLRYSKEKLLDLRVAPLSQKKPEFSTEVPASIIDSERWDRKKSTTPVAETSRLEPDRRRACDPRERIRKENDGIVLSPQRRSFNSGCFVPNRSDVSKAPRPHSPLGKSEHIVRDIQARRIGSGRILRDWDFDKREDSEEFSFRRQEDKFERRSFGRDFEVKEKETRRNGRFERRRMERDEEPEWFSGGPASQNDTIELRGFEDGDSGGGKKKINPARAKRNLERWKKKRDELENDKEEKNERAPTPLDGKRNGSPKQKDEDKGSESFNFDDILKCDSFSLLTNGVGGEGESGKSRFSHWFRRESPDKDKVEEQRVVKELFENEPIAIPGDAEAYFAPISPAANTGKKNLNIMEMLRGGKEESKVVPGKIMNLEELEAKMRQNVEQPRQQKDEDSAAFKRLLAQVSGGQAIPAKMPMQGMSLMEMLQHSQQEDARKGHLMSPGVQAQHKQQHVDMFMSKLMGAQQQQLRNSPLQDIGVQQSRELLNRPEAQAILQGLKRGDITAQHLCQQLANPALQPRHRDMLNTILKFHGGVGPSPRVLSPVPPHAVFQQQQQQQLRVSPLQPSAFCVSPIMATSPNTLTVPAMHQRIPSPRELQVHTQNILQRALIKKKLEEQQENYRKKQELQRGQSPSSAASKNVSSPTPLAFTPTSVLRKMTAEKEEGKENKTEKPQGRALTGMRQQPAVPQVQPQWNNQFPPALKQPVGRAIVKANNFQGNQEALFAQQRLMQQQQQQQQQQVRKPTGPFHQVQQQQLQPSHAQYNSQFGHAQQLTQQQLRAQHQQHARPAQPMQQQQQHLNYPQQQNNQHVGAAWQQFINSTQQGRRVNDGELSPTTSNQLARWFSPDLLERARGGELPSTAGLPQHVLSLEEIERQTAPPVHN